MIDVPPPLLAHNSRFAAVYELGPLKQGTNYVAPQRNSSGEPCECNTVMYRYRAYFRACALRTSANLWVIQLVHGVYCLSKRHHPVVGILEPVLYPSLCCSVPRVHSCDNCCSTLGFSKLYRMCSMSVAGHEVLHILLCWFTGN